MYILAVDQDILTLKSISCEIYTTFPNAQLQNEPDALAAANWAAALAESGHKLEYAFLDTQHGGMELAKQLLQLHPKVHLIFCTSHPEYAYDAFCLHAKGYLLKPVDANMITGVLDHMVPDWKNHEQRQSTDIRVHTFGHFDIFVNNKQLIFEREKAKELLAYLVDRRGASVTTEQIADILWENENYDRKLKNRTTTVISSLRKTLRKAGIEDILVKTWNHLALDTAKIHCDSYDYENQDILAVNTFRGEYMVNYSWAEFTTGRYIQMEQSRNR